MYLTLPFSVINWYTSVIGYRDRGRRSTVAYRMTLSATVESSVSTRGNELFFFHVTKIRQCRKRSVLTLRYLCQQEKEEVFDRNAHKMTLTRFKIKKKLVKIVLLEAL